MSRKHTQLGMNAGTASYRLTKDLLFQFVREAGHVCYQCGEPMTRDNFSIEHKRPWLDSADPVGLFFDLENIAYSHRSCNYAAAARPHRIHADAKERSRVSAKRCWDRLTKEEQRARRRDKYLRYGK